MSHVIDLAGLSPETLGPVVLTSLFFGRVQRNPENNTMFEKETHFTDGKMTVEVIDNEGDGYTLTMVVLSGSQPRSPTVNLKDVMEVAILAAAAFSGELVKVAECVLGSKSMAKEALNKAMRKR